MEIVKVVIFFISFWFLIMAEEIDNKLVNNGNTKGDYNSPQILQTQHPITWSSYNIIATTTALVVVAAGVTAFIALILPLIAYKICYLLGSCNDSFFTYVNRFVASDVSPRKNFDKRSAEYLGPILQALSVAYEKYERYETKKKPKMSSFYKE